MALVVQKYGGATLSDPEKIKSVAHRLNQLHKQNTKVVAVVSAMGTTTNELIELAQKVAANPSRREMDMLLSTGERVSMSLVSMALNDLGCPAISFTGSQAGILTNQSHISAFIQDVKAFRVEEALEQNKIVILAGFQGVCPQTKEITTLGRGGSDTTAVAIAAFLKADRCEILKDVPAIFSADPRVCNDVKPISKLTYQQLMEMTFWGAKVLHYRSVELAHNLKVPLYIGPAKNFTDENQNIGSFVSESVMFESNKILSINSHEKVFSISAKNKNYFETFESFKNLLDKNEIAFPQLFNFTQTEQGSEFYITAPKEIMSAIESVVNSKNNKLVANDFKIESSTLATVTATCTGITSSETIELTLKKLSQSKINFSKFFTHSMSLTFVVQASDRTKTIEALHSLV